MHIETKCWNDRIKTEGAYLIWKKKGWWKDSDSASDTLRWLSANRAKNCLKMSAFCWGHPGHWGHSDRFMPTPFPQPHFQSSKQAYFIIQPLGARGQVQNMYTVFSNWKQVQNTKILIYQSKYWETRQIWGIWKLRPAYSPETPNLGQNRWCFVLCDLENWWMTLENNRASLLCCFKLCVTFHSHRWIQTGVTVRKRPIWVKFNNF